jgi:hypothetical protein
MYYVNVQEGRSDDTVDQYETFEAAYQVCCKRQSFDHGRAFYYVSRSSRPNWDSIKHHLSTNN